MDYKSKSTEHKKLKSKESKISCNICKNDSVEIKDTFDLYEQIGKDLNNTYLNQNIILMTDYMKRISDFSPAKRIILLDWIMEICCYSHFKRETFHMTVSLIDICFSKLENITVNEFQLIIKCRQLYHYTLQNDCNILNNKMKLWEVLIIFSKHHTK